MGRLRKCWEWVGASCRRQVLFGILIGSVVSLVLAVILSPLVPEEIVYGTASDALFWLVFLLPLAVPVLAAVVIRWRLPQMRRFGTSLSAGPLVVILISFGIFLYDPLGLHGDGEGHWPNALHWTSPDPWEGEEFTGLDQWTAEALDRAGTGREFNKNLRFVDAETPSTGNLVVSVHPIDRFTWAATALASNSRCYALLVLLDPEEPEQGGERYARFPPGTPCKGALATAASVRLSDIPD